jgi:hypothetical protein
MKFCVLFSLVLIIAVFAKGQDIKLEASILSSAGSTLKSGSVNISKWRLGEVHSVVLQSSNAKPIQEPAWKVNPYPNPFNGSLNLEYLADEKGDFIIEITDITGSTLWVQTQRTIFPNEIIRLDLTSLAPAMYLLKMIPNNKGIQQTFKIVKH